MPSAGRRQRPCATKNLTRTDCVSDGAQYAASFRLRPHGAGGGSGDVPPPEGDFITGRLSEEVKVLEAALA